MEKKYIITINGKWPISESIEFSEAQERLKKLYDLYKGKEYVTVLGERSFAACDTSVLFEIVDLDLTDL